MSDAISELRERLGASAALWAGSRGVSFQEHGWAALSGARSVDYNVVLCTGDGDELDAGVERVLATRVPAVVMVAGPALAEVQRLVARDWVCIGATPVMVRDLDRAATAVTSGPSVRRLRDDAALAAARGLITAVFEIEPALAEIALPAPGPNAAHELWGAFDAAGELRSCLALVSVGETVVVWSMASAAEAQGHGYGRAALEGALTAAAQDGAERALLYASVAGEPFYRRLGFREVERWQMWSRPRWVLGRA